MKKIYITLLILLVSCVAKDLDPRKLDPTMNADYQELKDKLLPHAENKNNDQSDASQEALMPNMTAIIAPPPEPMVGHDKLVSISINDDVPLKEVFIELSRLADIDIEIDPTIKGGVILRARNKPFSEVVDRICDLSKLRYSSSKGTLRIENDNPFLVNYNLDFLNIIRTNTGGTSLSTGLSGSSAGGGSTTTLSSKYDNDLWGAIEIDIKKIFSQNSSASADSGDASSTTSGPVSNYITSNKQAGIVGVFATNKQHKMIKSYLEKVRDSSSSQVLIEAKIVDIALNDQYQSGVNFNMLNNNYTNQGPSGIASTGNGGGGSSFNNTITALTGNAFNLSSRLNASNLTLNSAVQLTQQFGAARTLSSPRINAMNNQQAVLSFVDNQVYFSVTMQNTPGTTSNGTTTAAQLTINSTSHTVPIGIMLTLQPSINLDTEEITMNIRPTITNISDNISDPASAYAIAQAKVNQPGLVVSGLSSSVPVVSVKELDSILKIKNGEIMVIGGMMKDTSTNKDEGAPFLMSIPLFGNLFKSVSKENKTTQTVIFIQATIVPSDNMKKKDKDTYNNFVVDKEVRI
jgi:general secretion pathway protein D